MSNGNPGSSGDACPDTFNEGFLHTFSVIDDCQSTFNIEDWFDNVSFNFDGAVASCETKSNILVDLPPESDGIGLRSPFLTTAPDQQPCAEADFLGSLYNSTSQGLVYGDIPYQQPSSDLSTFGNTIFDYLNGNSVLNQYAATLTSPSSFLLPKTRPDAAKILETPALEHCGLPDSAPAESQRPSYHCDSQIAKAQFSSGQTTCLTCGHTFARAKDLKRHKSSVHREDDDPVYLCRCGKDDPRKDNHARHVGVCVKPPCLGSYVCRCSHPSQGRDDHLEHVKSCSPGKRSRRRPNAS